MNDSPDDITARLRRSLDGRRAPELSPELVSAASTRTAPKVVNPQRRLQLAGGVTFAVAAVAVGALVVTSPFQQDPLFIAGGSQSGGVEAATMDMRIAPWVNYVYEAGAGLSTEGGSGSVYQLQRAGSAEETLAAIGDVFDLEGDPVKSDYFDEAYPTWVVGPQDGTAPNVTITWAGTGNWWYSDPTAYPQAVCSTSELYGVETLEALEGQLLEGENLPGGVCEVPEVAENLAPSEAEARVRALDLFEATGLDVAAEDIRVTADEWQTSASANLTVDGTQTAIDWGVAWSPTGRISYAYGHTIDVLDRGDYGTVSATEAVERLADWRWFGSAGPEYQGGMNVLAARSEVATDSPAGVPESGTVVPEELPGSSPTGTRGEVPSIEPDPQPTILPELPEPPRPLPGETVDPGEPGEPTIPEPRTVTVTVDHAEATLLLMWDADGNAWLVPGFAMQQPEGWWNSVVSLEEGVIQLPEPVEPMPFEIDEGFGPFEIGER